MEESAMKAFLKITASLALAATFGSLFLISNQPVTSSELQPKGNTAKVPDSDGDGIHDEEDEHPFIADIRYVSWHISPVSIGWRVDSSINEQQTSLSEDEQEVLKRKEFTFGGRADASAGIDSGGKASLSANPLKAFGLTESEAHVSYSAQFGVSSSLSWSQTDQLTAKTLLRAVNQTQNTQTLSDLNIEFTVNFYNRSEHDFTGKKMEVPIKVGSEVVTFAQPIGANGPDHVFSIPSGRESGTPIRFRASLDTTQSRTLLKAMQSKAPDIRIEESQGQIAAEIKGQRADATSALSQIMKKTCMLSIDLDGDDLAWSVARCDEQTGKRLSLADAFEAVNALAGATIEKKAAAFHFSENYLRSALGRDASLNPVRWWVVVSRNGEQELSDVNPSEQLPSEMKLRYQFGFPKQTSKWVDAVNEADPWALNVAAKLLMCGSGDTEINQIKGVEFTRKAADLGDSHALTALGFCYATGLGGIAVDEMRAIELYNKAAKLGDARATVFLAVGYLNGKGGLTIDEKKAVELIKRSAASGEAIGIVILGQLYEHGRGMKGEQGNAVYQYQKAAELGEPFAMVRLGICYEEGEFGVTKNHEKAVDLFQRAAALGNSQGVGYMHPTKQAYPEYGFLRNWLYDQAWETVERENLGRLIREQTKEIMAGWK